MSTAFQILHTEGREGFIYLSPLSENGRDICSFPFANVPPVFLPARRRELDAAKKRITELKGIFKRLYEDRISGRIADERFTELSADHGQEQAALKERVAQLQAELAKAQEASANVELI